MKTPKFWYDDSIWGTLLAPAGKIWAALAERSYKDI